MATKFSQIVGQPFGKNIKDEFERRKGLDQSFDNTSELYQPYFKIRRLKNLESVANGRTPNDDEYLTDRFAQLGKVYSEENGFSFGLDDLEDDSELRGFPNITDVSFELEDFTFYRTTINFEIPDVTYFQEFRDLWLNFGAPIQMEWGRYSPVEFEEDSNEDLYPNFETRLGNVVKFDYSSDGAGKSITGSLTIYSVTWLPVLQEGNAEDYEADEFKSLMTSYLMDTIKNPMKNLRFEEWYKLEKNTKKFIETMNSAMMGEEVEVEYEKFEDNNDKLNLKDYLWSAQKIYEEKEGSPLMSGRFSLGSEGTLKSVDKIIEQDVVLKSVSKVVKKDYSNVDTIEEFINCHFSLDKEKFGSGMYYFISLRTIELILNRYYSYNTYKKENGLFKGNIFNFDLSNCVINNFEFKGIKTAKPDKVLINPRNNKYSINDDEGGFEKDNEKGQYYLSGDIFISAPTFFSLLEESRHGYSFVTNLLNEISNATGDLISLKQKREDGQIIQGNIISNGISLVDSSTIIDKEDDSYTFFKLHDPSEKIKNFDLSTEIGDDISNMIFFKSRGVGGTSSGNESFLFSNQLNLRHFQEVFWNTYEDHFNSHFYSMPGDEFGDGEIVDVERREDSKLVELENEFDIKINPRDNIILSGSGLEGNNIYDLSEYYNLRSEILNKMEYSFSNINNSVLSRVGDYLFSDSLKGSSKVSEDKIIDMLTFLHIYYSQVLEERKTEYFSKNNFRMPYTLSIEFDGIAGILPSQAFKVDLSAFPVDYSGNEEALFIVTGLSHEFNQNSWTTNLEANFWIDSKKSTFLNKSSKGTINEELSNSYRNKLSALQITFAQQILESSDDFLKFLKNSEFVDYQESGDSILEYFKDLNKGLN